MNICSALAASASRTSVSTSVKSPTSRKKALCFFAILGRRAPFLATFALAALKTNQGCLAPGCMAYRLSAFRQSHVPTTPNDMSGIEMAVGTAMLPEAAKVAIAPSIIKNRKPEARPIIRALSPVSCRPVRCIKGTATNNKTNAAMGRVNR